MKRTRLRSRGLATYQVLTRECDGLVRQIVLERDQWKCRACGIEYEKGAVLQVAHIMPKGHYRSLRHDLRNVVLLCKPCHFRQHAIGHEKQMVFFARIIGIEKLAQLEALAMMPRKSHLPAVKVLLIELLEQVGCRTR